MVNILSEMIRSRINPNGVFWKIIIMITELLGYCSILLHDRVSLDPKEKPDETYLAEVFVRNSLQVPKMFDGSQQTLRSSNSSRTAENHGYQRVCVLIKKLPPFLRFRKPQTLMVTMVTIRVCGRIYSFSWKRWLYTSMKHAPSAVPDQTANSIVTMVTMRVCGLHFMNMCCICRYDFHYIFQRYRRWFENGQK